MDIHMSGGEPGATLPAWFLALLPLAGVYLGSWLTGKQQRRQLAHDAQQRAKDRATALRKDAVMDAVEAHAKLMYALTNAPLRDNKQLDKARVVYTAALLKLELCGGAETAKQAHELPMLFSQAHMSLQLRIHRIRTLRAHRETLMGNVAAHEAAVARLTQQVAAMQAPNPQVQLQLVQELDRQRGIEVGLIDSGKAEQRATDAKLAAEMRLYLRKLLEVAEPIAQATMEMLNKLRADLDVPELSDETLRQMKAYTDSTKAKILAELDRMTPPGGDVDPAA